MSYDEHYRAEVFVRRKNNIYSALVSFFLYLFLGVDRRGVGKNGTGKNGTRKNDTGKNGTRKKRHPEEMALCKFGKNGTSRKNVSLFS